MHLCTWRITDKLTSRSCLAHEFVHDPSCQQVHSDEVVFVFRFVPPHMWLTDTGLAVLSFLGHKSHVDMCKPHAASLFLANLTSPAIGVPSKDDRHLQLLPSEAASMLLSS